MIALVRGSGALRFYSSSTQASKGLRLVRVKRAEVNRGRAALLTGKNHFSDLE